MSFFKLALLCRGNGDYCAVQTMNENPNIDLMDLDGVIFLDVIKNKNQYLLRKLLEYYEKNQMQGDSNSIEYKAAKYKLQQVLVRWVYELKPPNEILEILETYLPNEDSNSEQDLSGFDSPPDFDTETFQSDIEEIRTVNANISEKCNSWD